MKAKYLEIALGEDGNMRNLDFISVILTKKWKKVLNAYIYMEQVLQMPHNGEYKISCVFETINFDLLKNLNKEK